MSVLPPLDRLKRVALDFFFPRWCLGCGREGDFICPSCSRSLPHLYPPICPRCGLPQLNGVLCPACIGWPAAIDGMRAPFRFEGAVREAVHQLKYRNLRAATGLFAAWLADYLARYPLPGDVLVPVPLHPRRLRERGYNQSALLARELGKVTGLPVSDNVLVRTVNTSPQARAASVAARRRNVAGSFASRDRQLEGLSVLLIDDVATTGSTLNDCARALKAGGAVSVWGLTLAREV